MNFIQVLSISSLLFICCLFSSVASAQLLPDLGNTIAEWPVDNGQLNMPSKQMAPLDSIGKEYWRTLQDMLPDEPMRKYVTSLRLFTDGRDEYLAAMNRMDTTNSSWQIDLDTADVNLNETDSIFILDYTHTIIHEFGHILTLNSDQVEPTNDLYEDPGKGYLTTEGYAVTDSYLCSFVNEFWQGEMIKRWDKISKIRSQSRFDKFIRSFYEDHKEKFVTDYAAESPEEDIAESWTFFILSDKPSGKEMKHQKVLFFYNYLELVEYRDEIRASLKLIPADYIENYVPLNELLIHRHH